MKMPAELLVLSAIAALLTACATAGVPADVIAVRITTGPILNAGTDAEVSLRLIFTDGTFGPIVRLPADRTDFERGSEDEFPLEGGPASRIHHVRIWQSNDCPYAGWYLESLRLVISSAGGRREDRFNISPEGAGGGHGRWLAEDEMDGATCLDLDRRLAPRPCSSPEAPSPGHSGRHVEPQRRSSGARASPPAGPTGVSPVRVPARVKEIAIFV
jgi:hypothetical protein